MSTKRLIQILIVASLVTVLILVTQQVLARTIARSQINGVSQQATPNECANLPSRYSIRPEVVKETGTRLTYTEEGPTGIDGGLIDLYSKYRTCSTK